MLSPAEGEAFGSRSILQPVYGTGYDCRVMWLSTGNTDCPAYFALACLNL